MPAAHACVMEFSISVDHPSLPGHFPGRPVVPGVLLLDRVLEAIETTGGASGALRLPQVKFLRPLLPGEIARIELQAQDGPVWRFRILRGDELIASGEVAAA